MSIHHEDDVSETLRELILFPGSHAANSRGMKNDLAGQVEELMSGKNPGAEAYLIGVPSRPAERPQRLLVWLHSAVGSPADFLPEARLFGNYGFVSVLVLAPYSKMRSTPLPFRFENPQREIDLWSNTAEELSFYIDQLAKRFNIDASSSAAIGRNLGGSQLAHWYTKDSRLKNLLITGAVPELSRFWLESKHSLAVQTRQQSSSEVLQTYCDAMKPFDLTNSLSKLSGRSVRLQFGRQDPWLDGREPETLGEIVWLDDDHDMDSPISREDRRLWINRLVNGN